MKLSITLSTILFIFAGALLAADQSGYIKARGTPTGAGLFIDGKYVGPAGRFTVPEKYTLAPGDHEIALRDPRFADFSTKVTVQTGKTTKLHYKLQHVEPAKPPFGRLRFGGGEAESFISVAGGDTGAVYINGKYYGFVDELNNAGGGLLLNPGTYEVRVDSPRFGSTVKQVTIEANKVVVIPLEGK